MARRHVTAAVVAAAVAAVTLLAAAAGAPASAHPVPIPTGRLPPTTTRPLLPDDVAATYQTKFTHVGVQCPTSFTLRGTGAPLPGVDAAAARSYAGHRIAENGAPCDDGSLVVVRTSSIDDAAVVAAAGDPGAARRLRETPWSATNLNWSTSVGFHVGDWECPGAASWGINVSAMFSYARYSAKLASGNVVSLPAGSRNLVFVNSSVLLCMMTAPPGVGAPSDPSSEPGTTNGEDDGVAVAPVPAPTAPGGSDDTATKGGSGGGGLSVGATAGVAAVAVVAALGVAVGAVVGTREWKRRRQAAAAPADDAAAAAAASLSGRPPAMQTPMLILDSLDGGVHDGAGVIPGGKVKRNSLGEPPPLPEELWDTVGSSATSGGKI